MVRTTGSTSLLADRGHARFTTPAAHQAAYDGMPSTLARLEEECLADGVRLYGRGNVVLYANRFVGGAWEHPPGAVAALHEVRMRPFTPAQKVELALGWQRVWTQMQERSAPAQELEPVRVEREGALQAVHADGRAQAALRTRVDAQTFAETQL